MITAPVRLPTRQDMAEATSSRECFVESDDHRLAGERGGVGIVGPRSVARRRPGWAWAATCVAHRTRQEPLKPSVALVPITKRLACPDSSIRRAAGLALMTALSTVTSGCAAVSCLSALVSTS